MRRSPAYLLGFVWGWLRAAFYMGLHEGTMARIRQANGGKLPEPMMVVEAEYRGAAATDPIGWHPRARPEDYN